MTTKTTTEEYPEMDLYFWLGQEAELTSLTEEEFKEKYAEELERLDRWKDVDVVSGSGAVDD